MIYIPILARNFLNFFVSSSSIQIYSIISIVWLFSCISYKILKQKK